ncbi:uncharacterized protein LOC121386080 [Gigantopelta aegis]|uniref:uncharacterized protein LOC121386080 n=1 Tax=Gigantopelta aegis TaxID=1735272 RepID=UPI001B88C3FA|nr:uncharacterized protein LOC121386080 [Gigantopelta aegis]
MHNYLDDWLIPETSQTACLVGVEFVIDMILRLGFIPNCVKSELVPTQVFSYLGVVFNLVEASVLPTDSRLHNFMMLAQRLLVEQSASVCTLHVLIGHLESLAAMNVRFRQFKRPLQWHLSRVWDGLSWDLVIPLGPWFILPIQKCLVDKWMWTPSERSCHINLLEMEAVHRACLHFRTVIRHRRILLRLDNTSVEILEWCDDWGVVLSAKHIPSSVDVLADSLSHRSPVQTEWMLHRTVDYRVLQLWGSPQLDMFATRLNSQLSVFVSPVTDPLALEYDALSMDWTGLDFYAFHPPVLLGKVLAKIRQQPCRVTLVAPSWAAQAWFPPLLSLLVQEPVRLPLIPDLLNQRLCRTEWHPKPEVFRLHAWWLSGFPSETEAFLNGLQTSSPLRSASLRRGST